MKGSVRLRTMMLPVFAGFSGTAAGQFPEPPTKAGPSIEEVRNVFADYVLPRFELPSSTIRLARPARPKMYFDSIGTRSFICGTEDGSYEAWIWPLQIFVDAKLSFRPEKDLQFFEMHRYANRIETDPDRTTIRYLQAEIAVDATFVAPDEQPVIFILLAVDADKPGTLSFSFVPKLQPQWPAAVGGVAAKWEAPLRAFVISEPSGRHAAVVGCPHATRATEGMQYLLPGGTMRFEIPIDPERCRLELIPIAVTAVADSHAVDRAKQDYQRFLRDARTIVEEHAKAWTDRLAQLTRISTPDPQLDLAFSWNAVSLRQSLVRSDKLGDGLIAGYGPAGATSQRPGFAWFFTGDVSINADAYLGAGLSETLAVGLRFGKRHQRKDGKIPHEVVLSAHLCDWFDAYPFAYIHGDTTPMWIRACRQYVDMTADRAFLDEMWPAIQKAYRWILEQDEDGDGLPDNTLAGQGASEVGALLYDLRTDIYLASMSAIAFRDVADLAQVLGYQRLSLEAATHAVRARQRIEEGFWDELARSLAHAIHIDGSLSQERTVWPAVPIALGLVEGQKAHATMDHIDSEALTTPWGVRILSRDSKYFDPVGYNAGAVWPFVTGLAALADFQIGRAEAGFAKVRSAVDLTFAEALGRVPEVLSGTRPRSLDTSVPHQMFASMSVVGPVVRGLLGVRPGALEGVLQLEPCLPAGWTEAEISNLPFGKSRLRVTFRRRAQTYDVDCFCEPREAGPAPRVVLNPRNGQPGQVNVK